MHIHMNLTEHNTYAHDLLRLLKPAFVSAHQIPDIFVS